MAGTVQEPLRPTHGHRAGLTEAVYSFQLHALAGALCLKADPDDVLSVLAGAVCAPCAAGWPYANATSQ